MSILVTGGAGYIGSHTCIELMNAGYNVVVVDNFYNSKRESLRRIAELSRAVVVLKGWRTLVCEAGRDPVVCEAGNPGMATGGSGDVLTGVIAALWGQGMAAFDAACLGVWLHATAGDLAAEEVGEESLIARDIVSHLGRAFRLARENAL